MANMLKWVICWVRFSKNFYRSDLLKIAIFVGYRAKMLIVELGRNYRRVPQDPIVKKWQNPREKHASLGCFGFDLLKCAFCAPARSAAEGAEGSSEIRGNMRRADSRIRKPFELKTRQRQSVGTLIKTMRLALGINRQIRIAREPHIDHPGFIPGLSFIFA